MSVEYAKMCSHASRGNASLAAVLSRRNGRGERRKAILPVIAGQGDACHGPIAQRLEQRTHNPLVPGSNPGGPTMATSTSPAASCADCMDWALVRRCFRCAVQYGVLRLHPPRSRQSTETDEAGPAALPGDPGHAWCWQCGGIAVNRSPGPGAPVSGHSHDAQVLLAAGTGKLELCRRARSILPLESVVSHGSPGAGRCSPTSIVL